MITHTESTGNRQIHRNGKNPQLLWGIVEVYEILQTCKPPSWNTKLN